ncbi:MAG: efflux RND transporter permease subunit [Acidobacteria bacterium]|nr:MAG: efflux RND transporter permease subunit [Acidobacteriota bacterium]
MTTFFEWIVKRRWAVLFVGALLVLGGLVAWARLPIDAFPDVTNIQVMVLSKAGGLSATDVEQRVTYPIEQQMGGLPRVTLVRSLSRAGVSQVVIVFKDSVDPYFARQLVFERLQGARQLLPPGIEPELAPLSTGLGEIFQYTIEGEGFTPMEKRTIQTWLVAPLLRTVPGVTEVNSFGGEVKQYQVVVHPDRLLKYGLTLREVTEALERSNANAGAGLILKGWEQMYIRGVGLFATIKDIENVVLKAQDGTPVFVRDLADVVVGPQLRQGAVTRDGSGETVAGMAIMLRGENSKTVVSAVKDAVAKIRERLPEGMRIDVFYDRTELIEACIKTVQDALLQGGILVIVVLFLFLAEFRTAAIVVLSLPITFLFTFIIMGATGLSSNLMSLGGLAFSVGMVVDASIVVAENVRHHLAEHRERRDRGRIVVEAMVEVAQPVTFSVLIIALVLLPLLTLQGLEGKMFAPLALTLLFSLLTSIIVALLLVPTLSHILLKQEPERELGFVRRFKHGYDRLLQGALRRPKTTYGIALAVLAGSALLIPLMGTDFMPPLDEGSIAINVVRLPNASLEGSVEVAAMIEKRLLKYPEVATVVSKSGRAEISEDPMGPEQTDVFVMLKPKREWKTGRNKAQLVEALSADLAKIPGLRAAFSQPIALRVNELISGVKSDLAVKVFGPDLPVLKEVGDKAATALLGIKGARDVKMEQVSGMAEVEVRLDREAMARYALNVGDVNELLEAAFAGRTVSTFVEGERRFAVLVRFPEGTRRDIPAIEQLLVPSPAGQRVPLGQIASVKLVEGPMQISRESGMRRVVVEANVRGRDLGGFVGDVRNALKPLLRELPTGYFVELGGQFENQQRAMRRLAIVVPMVLLLILFLLYSALGSARNAALVLLNLPFALVGGVVAAVAFRMTLSVSAAVAFIVLLGIAVQNGVVLVAFFKQLRERGVEVGVAVAEGCRRRFKPLMMTALVSFIGHLPMVYATGSGADIQKPLAVIVMGGIITSTLLTLLVLPVLYHALEKRATAAQESR